MRVRIDTLSAAQKECLRLVNAHLSSKEIARKLGISRHTADQRIALACQKLGVTSRREAAVAFSKYNSFIYDPSYIALPAGSELSLPDVQFKANGESDQGATDNSGVPQISAYRTVDRLPNALPFPRRKGDRNDLTIPARLAWAFAVFVMAVLVSGALIAALEVLGRLL